MKREALLVAVALAASEVQAQFNSNMQYFVADMGPTIPCHPLYERAYTWVDVDNTDNMDRVLQALSNAGFNAIRLPMWPDDPRVEGPDPGNEARNIGREFCDDLNKAWVDRIFKASVDRDYFGMQVYFSPAYDNKIFQETLTKEEYADWVLSYLDPDYSPDFVSLFSGNFSTLMHQQLGEDTLMTDRATMWELDVLRILKQKPEWVQLSDLRKPKIIGPDRATVSHTINTLQSFDGSAGHIRPEYAVEVDIVGTQARYTDQSATFSNFSKISGNGLIQAWCTMCSQEWYRQVDGALGVSQLMLKGPRVQSGYWANYQTNRGAAQPPASQALVGKLQGYVAEAAIPRFVTRQGQVNTSRQWQRGDKMIDTDGDSKTYDATTETQNRNALKPLAGFRQSLAALIQTQKCEHTGDDGIDRILPAYQTCSFELTAKEFEVNKFEPIEFYADAPLSVLAFIETCRTIGQQLCNTDQFFVGSLYRFQYDPNYAVRIIFENEDSEDALFTIEYELPEADQGFSLFQ